MPERERIASLLRSALAAGASDLHLSAGCPPLGRIDGGLAALQSTPLAATEVDGLCLALLTPALLETLEVSGAVDFAAEDDAFGRIRANVFRRRGCLAACVRFVCDTVPPLASLGLPARVEALTDLRHGLVLVTGPTGNGKSTTLAAFIRELLERRPVHVLTIEDPIEVIHAQGRGLVQQRELGSDTPSFAQALRHALRQDPDAILVGEMRDAETVNAALTLAETGHLVMSTLHSRTASQAVRRVIDLFPIAEHAALRSQLAEVLQAIIAQILIPRAGGGRVLASELLIANGAVRALVRDDKIHQIQNQIEAGQTLSGMQSMQQSIAALARAGMISAETAREHGACGPAV